MKKILFIILFISPFLLKAQCNQTLVDIAVKDLKGAASYLKDFKVRLKAQEPRKQQPVAKFSITLSKGQSYRFNVAADKGLPGQPIIQLYDGNKLQGCSFFKGKDYKSFDFPCTKTGQYLVFITFNEGKEGCAAGVLSVLK